MKSIPGYYSTSERRRCSRFTPFDSNSGVQTGLVVHGTHSTMNRYALGIVRAGVLIGRTGTPEWGLHCSACTYHWFNSQLGISTFNWCRKFTRESFEGHISKCGEIIDGKHYRFTELLSIPH